MNGVVITGLGVFSPIGKSQQAMTESLKQGKTAIKLMTTPEGSFARPVAAAEVDDYVPSDHFDESSLALLDRCTQFSLIAAAQAVEQSGLSFDGELADRTAVIVGTASGGLASIDAAFQRLYGEKAKKLHPFTIPKTMINAGSAQITLMHGITGPSFNVSTACSSANHAIALGSNMVRSGMVDAAVVGGSEAMLNFGGLKSWEAMRVMSHDTCRPFCGTRKGLVLGEGAAFFVIEGRTHAESRGAFILAEILGAGMSSDASDIVLPEMGGGVKAMQNCLRNAKLSPSDVDYINAHGTGTLANDRNETAAIHAVFEDHAKKLFISSTKSMHGHVLGATGAIELAATILALNNDFIPPTVNLAVADPECDLNYVPNEALHARARIALSNTFAFGGHNAVIAIKRG